MGVKEDLAEEVRTIFARSWTQRDGTKVPEPEDLSLGNDAAKITAAVLYADMADSTVLVDRHTPSFAAEVYKAYLVCAARIIRSEGGAITAYDGDRIMAVFIGAQRTAAARTALKINYAVSQIVNPAIRRQYPKTQYTLRHAIGVDHSDLFVARIGVRNDNDLVWVGRAANYAAKLSSLNDRHPIFITADVYDGMREEAKYGGEPKRLMWEQRQWSQMGNARVHSSDWTWTV